MSIIFYHDSEQEAAARKSIAAVEELKTTIYTELLPISRFYLAEDYHQKYYLQGEPELSVEIRAYYPDFEGFTNSTAAARLNGLVAGYGDEGLLDEEINSYGLSPRGRELLKLLVF
jgi:peptide-methionine (S)-S-oxide reductase